MNEATPIESAQQHGQLWTIENIMVHFQFQKSKVYQIVADPTFPRPIRLAGKARRWDQSEVKRWALRQR